MMLRTGMLVAALGLSGALLAGCGDDGSDAETEEATQNGESSSQASEGQTSAGDTNGEGGQQTASAEPVSLIFGTGGTGGTYYPIGGALKGVFEASDLVDDVQVVSTGASVQNINNITDGLNQIAIVMSDVAYDAVNGENQFDGQPADIQALAGLYPNVVQIVATEDSGIESIADLEGKRVGVGKVGSGVEQSAAKVIESADLSYDDLAQVSHTGYADSVTSMSNGNLDAAFFTSGVPNSSITGLMQSTDITFVPVSGDVADKLLEAYPYYETYTLPAGAPERYDLGEEVDTVAIRNMLIVSGDMRDDVAEELTQRFHDYLNSENVSVGALKQFDPDTMNQNLVAPVHPGAQAFYDSLSSEDGDADDTSDEASSEDADDAQS
ncbi:TAXI family TRAP transporter solute-binding subunit [Chromohalobacter moromii]|uniref:TAXI family TRAP transporter solute-binding subunit n=1 Tax=Chromohalobacter moromii TaxID=2860329 RepID=A0A9X2X2E5_9GAMM|nr:TAXI family TRAP transporter solute-binding subunit [Chromohalobacter moromii]MCK2046310.1 TAXI family TRAP transporter solute-binding subunit [Chromohalobacter moromii]MCT8505266.1 TAXI family TRAP transporter solute-binding subunit [Chromohalobacter moromii]